MGRTFSGDKDHPSVLSAAALNAADTSLLKKDAEKPLPIASATVIQRDELLNVERSNSSSAAALTSESRLATGSNGNCMSTMHKSVSHILPSSVSKFNEDLIEPSATSRKPTVWGRMAVSIHNPKYSSLLL